MARPSNPNSKTLRDDGDGPFCTLGASPLMLEGLAMTPCSSASGKVRVRHPAAGGQGADRHDGRLWSRVGRDVMHVATDVDSGNDGGLDDSKAIEVDFGNSNGRVAPGGVLRDGTQTELTVRLRLANTRPPSSCRGRATREISASSHAFVPRTLPPCSLWLATKRHRLKG